MCVAVDMPDVRDALFLQVGVHFLLSEVVRIPLRRGPIQIVFDRYIGASIHQKPHHRQVPVLRSQMQRRDALAMRRAAERPLLVHIRPMIEQPTRGLDSIAEGCPRAAGQS